MRIGVNLASFGPLAVTFPNIAGEIAVKRGCEFLSGLPFRGMQGPKFWETFQIPMTHWEPAWNPGPVLQWAIDNIEERLAFVPPDPGRPKKEDIVAFPGPEACKRKDKAWLTETEVILIVHSIKEYREGLKVLGPERVLLEINPGMFLSFEEIALEMANFIKYGRKPFCLDLRHLREEARNDQFYAYKAQTGDFPKVESFRLKDIDLWMERLLPYTRLIDFQASSRQELEDTFDEKITPLSKLWGIVLSSRYSGDVRIELPMGPKDAVHGYRILGETVDFLKS